MKARRAVSLTELLLTMSACALILTLSAAVLHRVMRAQSKSRTFVDAERNSLRLATQFRRDVQLAQEAQTGEADLAEGAFLKLELGTGKNVEYRRSAGRVSRISLDPERPASREEFAFPDDIELAIRDEGSPRAITLEITARPGSTSSPDAAPRSPVFATPVSLQVSACLGRLAGFAPPTADQEASP